MVAVGGRAADELLLARVSGTTEAEIATALDEATSQNLLVPSDDGTAAGYAFRHALLREALYDDLLPGARRRLHARYAEVLGERPRLDGAAGAAQLAEIAGHASAAHDLPLALRRWIEAGRASDAAFASVSASARTSGLSSSGTSSRIRTGPKGSSTSSCSRTPRARSSPAAR